METRERRDHFWRDTWLEDVPLISLATRLVSHDLIYRNVASFWRENLDWDWNILIPLLPQSTIRKLRSVFVYSAVDR